MPPSQADKDRARRIVARVRSYGIQVYEQPGCYEARDPWLRVPTRIIDHHDASTIASGEWGSLGYILRERIANWQVARCLDGVPKVALVAAGANCPHAGVGGPWVEVPRDSMNGWGWGVEKAATTGEKYTAAALYATKGLYHAIAVECGRAPGDMPVEHAEWGNIGHPHRKNDSDYGQGGTPYGGAGGNGNWMRQQVRDFQPTGDDDVSYASWPQADKQAMLQDIQNYSIPNSAVPVWGTDQWDTLQNTLAFLRADTTNQSATIAGLSAAVASLSAAAAGDGITPEELEAVVVKAIQENVVKVDVSVAGQ